MASWRKQAIGTKYKRDGVKARLQHLQSGQKNLQLTVSRVQSEINALAVGTEKDFNTLQSVRTTIVTIYSSI